LKNQVDEEFRFVLNEVHNSIKSNLKKILQEKHKTKSAQEIIKKYESKLKGSLSPNEYETIVHLM